MLIGVVWISDVLFIIYVSDDHIEKEYVAFGSDVYFYLIIFFQRSYLVYDMLDTSSGESVLRNIFRFTPTSMISVAYIVDVLFINRNCRLFKCSLDFWNCLYFLIVYDLHRVIRNVLVFRSDDVLVNDLRTRDTRSITEIVLVLLRYRILNIYRWL